MSKHVHNSITYFLTTKRLFVNKGYDSDPMTLTVWTAIRFDYSSCEGERWRMNQTGGGAVLWLCYAQNLRSASARICHFASSWRQEYSAVARV